MKFWLLLLLLMISSLGHAQRLRATGEFAVDTLAQINVPALNCRDTQLVRCAERYTSSANSPQSVCAEWTRGAMPFLATYPDGSVLVNPLAIDRALGSGGGKQMSKPANEQAGQLERESVAGPGELDRLRNMFSTVNPDPALAQARSEGLELLKRVSREQITQGRPPEALSENQRFLLFKLETLEVSYNYDEGCEGYPYNASYSGARNTLNICPLLTHMPVESYMSLLAHELGHMSDPCYSFMDFFAFSPGLANLRGDQPAQRNSISQQIQSCLPDIAPQVRGELIEWATGNTRMANQGLNIFAREDDSRRGLIDRLVGCGVVMAPAVVAPRTYEDNPFLPIISCVGNHHSRNQRMIVAGTRIQEGTNGESCDLSTTMSETIADYVGASLISRMLTKYPTEIDPERRAMLPMFYSSVQCSPSDGNESYLERNERMALFLENPLIQQAAGCEGSSLPAMCPLPQSLTGAQ